MGGEPAGLKPIERFAGAQPGDYLRDLDGTYLAFQKAIGTCLVDPFIPRNPLSMDQRGFQGPKGGTAGAGLQHLRL